MHDNPEPYPGDPRLWVMVYLELRREIDSGELADGTHLHLGDLSARFAVHRETVRKAIRELDARGYAWYVDGLGWYVRARPRNGDLTAVGTS